MATKRVPIELDFSANTSKAQKSIRMLNKELDDLLGSISKNNDFTIDKDLHKASVAAIELKQHLQNALNPETGKFDVNALNNSFKSMGRTLEDYRKDLSRAGAEGQQAFNDLAKEIVNAEVPLKRTNALLADFADTLQKTAKWQISSRLFNAFVGSLQEAYYYAQDLNESLNNIRIVTGKNVDQMAQFAKEANKAAQALSTTTTEYTNASLIYYQQGLSDSEVKERTDVTIKMANVSRESAETVSQQMTAVWNNFDNGSKSLEYYADVMTALGAATASSSAEIAEGLEKFAAIADTVGLSYEYATAALATVTATTRQSADIVGNSFKTLFARIQSLKLGETLDDGTTLNNYSQALAAVGISIKNTDGQLKDMNSILDEMGDKWAKLGKDQQVALAQTVAGVRQYSQLIALMDNWSFFQQNLGVAEGAEGTLGQQADIYAESWEAASDRVKAAAEEIYDQLLNDKFFIWLDNAFAGLLNLISNTVDALGGLKGVLSGIGLLLTKMYGKSIIETVSNFFMTQEKRYKQWFNTQRDALNELEANYRKLGATETSVNFEQILEVQEKLGERVNELSEDQVKNLQEQINLLKLRTEEMQKYELSYNQAERNKENTYRNVGLKTQKFNVAENRTERQIGKVLNIKNENVDKGKLKGAIDEYQKVSGSFKNLAEKARAAKKAIKEINEALGEAKTDKLFNGESIVENIDAANDAAIELEEAIRRDDEAKEHLKNTIDDLNNSARTFSDTEEQVRENIEKATPKAAEISDVITGMVQGITSLTMAFSSIKGIIDIWNDEDVSVGEKLLSTLSSLTIVIPSLISAYKALAIAKIEVSKGSAAEIILNSSLVKSLFGLTTAEGAATAGTVAFDVALKSLLWPIGLIMAAVAGLAVAFKAIKDASPEGQLKKARQEAEKLKEAFEEVKQATNDLISSFDKYDELVDTLHECTVGTEEWETAVRKVKEQVIELLDKYPELLEYVKTGKNGELYFEDEDVDRILDEAQKRQFAAKQLSEIANLKDDEIEFKRDSISKIFNKFGILDLEEANLPDYSILATLSKEKYLEALEKAGFSSNDSEVLANTQDIFKEIADERKTLNKAYKNIASLSIDTSKYNQFELAYIEGNYKNELDKLTNDIYTDWKNLNRNANANNNVKLTQLWEKYQKATGTNDLLARNAIRGKGDNREVYYIDTQGKTQSLDIETVARKTAVYEMIDKLDDEVSKQAKLALQNLSKNTTGKNAEGIEYFLLNNNFGNLTEGQLNDLIGTLGTEKENIKDNLKRIFNVDDLSAIVQLFGVEAEEQLIDSFINGFSNYDEIVNNYRAGMLEVTRRAFDQLSADGKFKELTPTVQKSVMNILETAFKSRRTEGLSAIKDLFGDMDSTQIESFVDAIEDVNDWTNITSKDLENLLKDNGIELELTEGQWELLLDSLKQSPYIISNVTKKYKELHDTLDKLQFGTEWDKSIYDKFGGDEKLGDYFLKTADGTYKFIGSLEELNKVYSDLNEEKTVKNFEKNIRQYQRVLSNGEDYYKNDSSFVVVANNKKIEDYLQLLEVAGEDTSDWRSKQAIGDLTQKDAIAIQEAVNNVDFSQMNTNLYSGMEQRAEAAQSFEELDELLKVGLITEEIYAKVKKAAKNSVNIADYEKDEYHNINLDIQSTTELLEDYNRVQQELNIKRKYYKDENLVTVIKKENENLKNINDTLEYQSRLYSVLEAEQKLELEDLTNNLNPFGAQFNENGALENYNDLMTKITREYEEALQEASLKNNDASKKAAEQAAEEEFNTRKEWLKRYEELYYNEIVDTENKIEENRQKQYENKISFIENEFEAINAGINKTLRLADAEKEYQDFLKVINSDFRGVIDKDYNNERELFNIDKDKVDAQIKRLKEFEEVVANLIKNGLDKDAINSIAEDAYLDINKELSSLASSLSQTYETAWNNYLKGLDNFSSRFSHLNDRAKRYTKELEYQKQLIELMYGDKAYELMGDYYSSQEKNINSQIQSMQKQVKFWTDQFTSLQSEGFDINNIDTWSDAAKKAYDEMISSQEELNSLIVSGVQNFKDAYLNDVTKTISNLDRGVWGGDFDALKADWDYVQNRAKNYLDEITGAYKIQTLSNKIDTSISETSSLKAQQKLMQLKEEELEYLREKDNLTQDDLDIAEARYQVALKEIALEESQKNKTSMKLTRDASGNWSYQYVADQDDILKKQQDLLDANQNLYEVSNRAYTNAIQLAIDAYDEYKQNLIEIANDTILTEEEKNARMKALQETYLEDMKAAMSNANIYSHNEFMDLTDSAKSIAAELIRTWSTDPESVEKKFIDTTEAITTSTHKLSEEVSKFNNLAGNILGEDGIKNAFTQVDSAVNDINTEVENLCDPKKEAMLGLTNLKSIVGEIAEAWGGEKGVKGQIENAYESLKKYLELYDKVPENTNKSTDQDESDKSRQVVPAKVDTKSGPVSQNYLVQNPGPSYASSNVGLALKDSTGVFTKLLDGSLIDKEISKEITQAQSLWDQTLKWTKGVTYNTNEGNTNNTVMIDKVEVSGVKNVLDFMYQLESIGREASMIALTD